MRPTDGDDAAAGFPVAHLSVVVLPIIWSLIVEGLGPKSLAGNTEPLRDFFF